MFVVVSNLVLLFIKLAALTTAPQHEYLTDDIQYQQTEFVRLQRLQVGNQPLLNQELACYTDCEIGGSLALQLMTSG
eukprot:scaffold946_cov171-Ochromonas_danica.AAC.9